MWTLAKSFISFVRPDVHWSLEHFMCCVLHPGWIKVLPVTSRSGLLPDRLSLGLLCCTRRPFTPAMVQHQRSAASWECVLSDTITSLSSQRRSDLSAAAAALMLPFASPPLPSVRHRWSKRIDFLSSSLLLSSLKNDDGSGRKER